MTEEAGGLFLLKYCFCPICGENLGGEGRKRCAHLVYWWDPDFDPSNEMTGRAFQGHHHPLQPSADRLATLWATITLQWLYPDSLVDDQEARAQKRLILLLDQAATEIRGNHGGVLSGVLREVIPEDADEIFINFMVHGDSEEALEEAAMWVGIRSADHIALRLGELLGGDSFMWKHEFPVGDGSEIHAFLACMFAPASVLTETPGTRLAAQICESLDDLCVALEKAFQALAVDHSAQE